MNEKVNVIEAFKYLIGKRIYVELNGGFSCISDLGIIEDVTEDYLQIDIVGQDEDFTLFKDSGYNLDNIKDLTFDDGEDKFLFRVTFKLSSIAAYFYEYEEDEE